MPITWIAWDVGGTLTLWSKKKHVAWLAQRYHVPREHAETVWRHRLREREQGKLSAAAWWRWAARALNTRDPLSVERDHMVAISGPRKAAMDALRKLSGRYRMAAIPNVTRGITPRIDANVGFRKHMDFVLESWNIGAVKPQSAYWRALCKRARAKPAEILVIDDLAHNVAAAKAYGFPTVHCTSSAALLAGLRRRGIRARR